jgi:hypothetical protein
MTQGLEAGITELTQGPDGAIYAGGLGADGNWGQAGKLKYGLQKLTPNGTSTFDVLAMRATATGFEMEYTQPLSTATAAAIASAYRVKQWRYVPTASYGGPKVDEQTLTVGSATVSADRRKVTLAVNGLQTGRVVHVRSPRPFTSDSGQSLWSTEAWYTLNAIPGAATGTNLALGKPATADSSCNANEGPAKAVNGSVAGGNLDKWCSLGASKWLQVDLGSSQSVNRLVVKHAGAGGENTAWNTRDFTLQVSTNGTSWSTVATVTGNTASTTTHTITAVSARYIRLNITSPGADAAARIYEFEAYGAGGEAAAPGRSPASAASASTSATPRPPTAPRSSCGPATAPPRSSGAGSVTRTGRWASASTSTTAAPSTGPRCSCGPATAAPLRCGSRRPTARS